MRDHGGDIDAAMELYGGRREDWLDLSTGINRVPYPVPPIEPGYWRSLPVRSDIAGLEAAAQSAFDTCAPVVALAGAQAAIQLVPLLRATARARVFAPTYNEHASALRALGWDVDEVSHLDALAGADLAIVVNPNNPNGQRHSPDQLLATANRVGLLVVDESFCDADPKLSVAPHAGRSGLIVLRSFGKFYGLAGVRLGFAIGSVEDIDRIRTLSGPWPISGAAIAIGQTALCDTTWRQETAARLQRDVCRLDLLADSAGWALVGGTPLFRLYDTPDAAAAKETLARHWIWSRTFPSSQSWLRLGLPGQDLEWDRLAAAMAH